jgi:hypothetical protein
MWYIFRGQVSTPQGHKMIYETPMGRFGEPDEVIGTLLYI